MKTKILALCLVFLMPLAAFGAEEEKAALAREMVALSHIDQLMAQAKQQVQQIQDQMMAQVDIPAEKKQEAIRFQQRVNDRVFEVMSFENMEQDYIDLFTSVYTADELRAILAFYKSPAGRSMLAKQPRVIQQSMAMTQAKLKILIPELQQMSREFKQRMKAE